MNLYAESSAVLAWLLGESAGRAVRQALGAAELVLASELTLVECDRALVRATATGALREGDAAARRARLSAAAAAWQLLAVGSAVLERSRRPFPAEPLRTLDALHLSSALVARAALPDLSMLSLDERLRRNARELGLALTPPEP